MTAAARNNFQRTRARKYIDKHLKVLSAVGSITLWDRQDWKTMDEAMLDTIHSELQQRHTDIHILPFGLEKDDGSQWIVFASFGLTVEKAWDQLCTSCNHCFSHLSLASATETETPVEVLATLCGTVHKMHAKVQEISGVSLPGFVFKPPMLDQSTYHLYNAGRQ